MDVYFFNICYWYHKKFCWKSFVNTWLCFPILKKFIIPMDDNGCWCAKHAQFSKHQLPPVWLLWYGNERERNTISLEWKRKLKIYDLKHSLCKLNALHPNYFVHSKLCTKYILKSSSPSSPTTFSFFMCFLPKFQHLKEQKQEFLWEHRC